MIFMRLFANISISFFPEQKIVPVLAKNPELFTNKYGAESRWLV